MTTIQKCAAIIVRDKRLLVVRKASTDVFISPGGKIDPGETQEDCLRREIREELGAEVAGFRFFGTFTNASALEAGSVTIYAYLTDVSQDLVPMAEIAELAWVGGPNTSPNIKIGSVFADHVIPELAKAGIIDA
ncbi:NUDIX domain-containing protein [Phaeobacter sp.]|uniref:NUDIX hydrolase n=1 Tax=Phaeobacter sp. TaxID=1902409 RepID=UPI0025D55F6B|nr:NUDIX domain-containing protein [Phaeobacter sp.]